jgi:1-acyl-sn-glycerol-3-phosphate acyltransferase
VPGDQRNLWWKLGTPLVRPIERALFRVRVEGIEGVPAGPTILAFNHVSVLDGPSLAIETSLRLRRELRFLAAAELFDMFFFGWVLRSFDQIPIRRGQQDSGALDEAIALVHAGALAAIAPEGRVGENPDAGLQRIRSGLARVALPAQAQVVPVGIWGTHKRWPKSGLVLARPWRKPRLAIVYGQPFSMAGDAGSSDDIEIFRERLGLALEPVVARARQLSG